MQGKVEICGVNTAKLRTLKPGEPEALLRRCMENVMTLSVPLKTEISIGGDWRACK